MKQLIHALKSARKIEILVIAAMLCVLLILCMNEMPDSHGESEEARMQRILSRIDGAGRVTVMIGAEGEGIVVAAEGADDVRVMLEIQRAVQTLTGFELSKIDVVKSKG